MASTINALTAALITLSISAAMIFFGSQLTFAIPDDHVPLFIFGDSLYDNGMTLYNGVAGAGAEFWPYGETFFTQPSGRYSDGRLIPDFIAAFAGLPFPQPYLSPGFDNYTNGVNFASAGACVLVELRPQTINMKLQMDYYLEMVGKLKKQVGEEEANKVLSKAVYLFNIGGNDYVTLFQKNLDKRNKLHLSPSQKKLRVSSVIGNMTDHIKTIYKNGGRKFAFQNIGPLGCMPSMKFMLGYKGACASEAQDLSRMHNTAFTSAMKKLESELTWFKYSVYDFFTSLSYRVLYGHRYGFIESKTACCGSGAFRGDFTCQKKGENFAVCSNPNDYLWFDAAHPTDKANEQFSKEFWAGGSNLVSPYNLQTLFRMH